MQAIAVIETLQEHLDAAVDFAERSVESSLDMYARRKQFNRQKITLDITAGKVAEFAVWCYVTESLGLECSVPDLEVYEAKKKSYAADMRYLFDGEEYPLHVKGQLESQAKRYSRSWIFQKRDKLVTQPGANDRLALCEIKDDMSAVTLVRFPFATAVEGRYKDLVLFHLSSKTALYFSDLQDLY